MNFPFTTEAHALNHDPAPQIFLEEMVNWAVKADPAIFAPNDVKGFSDIYGKVKAELGPYTSQVHRVAVMLEVMRLLAMFESDCDWTEGVDTSRLGPDTPENKEAGAWQLSYDARNTSPELRVLILSAGILDGVKFQRVTKFNHPFAMASVATLMRRNTKHNGPLWKNGERDGIRKSLRGAEHSIYPWLRREAVAEFEAALLSVQGGNFSAGRLAVLDAGEAEKQS